MLEQASPLNRSALHSALKSQSRLRPKGAIGKKSALANLLLTSLVDAFAILVIFLIMNNASNQETIDFDDRKLKLPRAEQSQLIEKGLVVKIDGSSFMVADKHVDLGNLAAELKAQKGDLDPQKDGIIIVADKKLDFADVSPVITAGSSAGFIKFKFAVQRKE